MASQFRKREGLIEAEFDRFEKAQRITSCEDCFWSILYSAPLHCAVTQFGLKRRLRQCRGPAWHRSKRISPPSPLQTGSKPRQQEEFYSSAVRQLGCGMISKSNLGRPSSSARLAARGCPIARVT